MDIQFLIKSINKSINSSKYRPSDTTIRNLFKSKFSSKDAEIIFGNFFSNSVIVFKFSKKLEPCFKIKETSYGRYISHLQLLPCDNYFIKCDKINRIEQLNNYLDKLDYESYSCVTFVDLTCIENIKFLI